MNRRALVVGALLLVGVCWTLDDAFAQPLEHGRGNILSIDMNRSTVDLRDPQNRVTTWRFRSDAKVKFTDGAAFFRNPSVRDLRPPMYVHYTFANEVIVSFDVVELGFQPGDQTGGSDSRKQLGVSRTVVGRVSAYDASVRQVAIEHNGQTEAFQLTGSTDQRLEPGTRVQLRTDWSGQRELVSELRVLADAARDERDERDSGEGAYNRRGNVQGKEGDARGRVVRISTSGVLMDVAGVQERYGVASSSLAKRLRAGETVRFHWENRDGKPVITKVD
jgi:hypothetical protein